MALKINTLQVENLKRVKAVAIEPTQNGLTVIGGRNGQGKTSVLDAITWALGGDRKKPSEPRRDGSVLPPSIKVTMSNGLRVERSGNGSTLKVIDPNGNKGGQSLLNEFVSELALDLPRFMAQSGKEKASTLLKIVGVGDRLAELDIAEERLYNERTLVGRERDSKQAHANELQEYPDAPQELVTATELIQRQQAILLRNAENQKLRQQAEALAQKLQQSEAELARVDAEIERLQTLRAQKSEALDALAEDLGTAKKTAAELTDESTAELEASIAAIEETNAQARANMEKSRAADEADEYARKYDDLTAKIEQARKDKLALLSGAKMPLAGLSVDAGELTFNGYRWDNMAASEQLRVAAAIVRKLNPNCGFVLLDKLEQMDLDTLREFGAWLEAEGLQAIATRVSTGEECSIVIEDGYQSYQYATVSQTASAAQQAQRAPAAATAARAKGWNGGGF